MNKFNSTPESISHKQLNSLLSRARKQPIHTQEQPNLISEEKKAFEDLLLNWSSLSTELLKTLKENHEYVVKDREANSIKALGALEAHLSMAVQAYKASDSE